MCGIHHTDFAVEEPVAPPPPAPPSVPKAEIVVEEIPVVAAAPIIVEEIIPPSFHALAHAEIRVEPISYWIALLILALSMFLAPLLPTTPQPKHDEL